MNINFKGICPPHKIGNIYVYPINKDLSEQEIKKYCKAINPTNLIGSGCNGDVFKLGMDLVIKKARPDALVNKSLMNEAQKLDILYNLEHEIGIKLNNIQSGIAGFEFDNGESYLISTLIEGKRANVQQNPFNEKNLKSLMDILTILDKGSSKTGRLMMYDLNLSNINLTKDKAGIFDFEYMGGENIETSIHERIIKKLGSASSHVSDTSNLQSNVRSFEYAGLYYYLREMPAKEVKNFLHKYLTIKSIYHKNMSEYYSKIYDTVRYPSEVLSIARSEFSHLKLLANPSADILKSEAIKIQMANFVFVSGQWCQNSRLKFNPEQIMGYYKEGLKYFKNELNNAIKKQNIDKQIYYQNCINLFKGWKRILTLPSIMNEIQIARTTNEKIKTLDNLL